MARTVATLAICVVLAMGSSLYAAGARDVNPQNLASYNWSVKASPNLATKSPSLNVIERFARSIERSALGESSLGESGGTEVCSFRFANLRNDGIFSLVVGIGVTQRPGCPNVDIIEKDRKTSRFQLFLSGGGYDAGTDIPGSIKDLRNDGNSEFIIENTLGVIPGRCTASWLAIYAWTGANYTNVSDQFKEFYRKKLESLQKAIATLRTESSPEGYSLSDKPCLIAEAATIQEFLGIAYDAGVDQIITLANGKDRFEREFAADVLGWFNTAKAHEYLERIRKDPNPAVKLYANDSLSRLSRGPVKFAPDSFQGPY